MANLGLFACVRAGGVAASLDEPLLEILRRVGLSLGTAFQIVDDVIDLEGSSELTGKNSLADLREGKLTWPLIVAAERDSHLAQQLREVAEGHRVPTPEELSEINSGVIASGALALDHKTFKEMSRRHPEVRPLRELRGSLSQLRLRDLTVGTDGRNRCLLSPFSSKTGRNQPSNSKFIFGAPSWLRGLIMPGPGRAMPGHAHVSPPPARRP